MIAVTKTGGLTIALSVQPGRRPLVTAVDDANSTGYLHRREHPNLDSALADYLEQVKRSVVEQDGCVIGKVQEVGWACSTHGTRARPNATTCDALAVTAGESPAVPADEFPTPGWA